MGTRGGALRAAALAEARAMAVFPVAAMRRVGKKTLRELTWAEMYGLRFRA